MRHVIGRILLAWVLWMQTTPRQGEPKSTWEIVDTLTEERTCKATALARERGEANNLAYAIRFLCLPETVDPRPKS